MTQIEASAPGKALISGEYAVLRGAPAICMAVDRRAIVQLRVTDGRRHRITAPGYMAGEWYFTARDRVEWHGAHPGSSFDLFTAVWSEVFAGEQPTVAFDLILDSQTFHDSAGSHKLGLGSSAAITVALAAALAEFAGRTSDVPEIASRAHRLFQSQQGSGVDLATSYRGGLVEYLMDSGSSQDLSWPADLGYRFVWTGVPIKTTSQLVKFGAIADDDKSLQALLVAAHELTTVWRSASTDEIILGLRRYTSRLEALDESAALGIFDGGHSTAARVARDRQLVYKPCGAGGGDIGIVVGGNAEQLADFERALMPHGLNFISAKMDSTGLAVRRRD